MNGTIALLVIGLYFVLLFIISRTTNRNADSNTFFIANRNTPWPLVAYGMIGVAISGITFISVPGQVLVNQFSYMQMVLGYSVGLLIVAFAMLPAFYRIQAISIYSYLGRRFGPYSHRTGSWFFILAQVSMAAIRLYLMAHVIQLLIMDELGFPFSLSVGLTLLLIFLYTYRGGIKTVILTDTLQTTFLMVALLATVWMVADRLDLSFKALSGELSSRGISQVFFWSLDDPKNFAKMFFAGILVTVMNNGLDQSIMQKHLTCRNLRASQKNLVVLALILILVNFLFLYLGGTLSLFSELGQIPVPDQTDDLYPLMAMNELGLLGGVLFLLGIAAAAYSSADSSLTGLTTSFCIDILKMDQDTTNQRQRYWVHFGFTVLIFLIILAIDKLNNSSTLDVFIKTSGYVYGPLMGLFAFGLLTRRTVVDRWVVPICILSPVVSLVLDANSASWFNGFEFGYAILVVNSLLTYIALYLLSLFASRSGTRDLKRGNYEKP